MRPLILFVLVCVCSVTGSAFAQIPPDDSGKFHLVLVTSNPPTPNCVRLLSSVDHPAVGRIAAACKYFAFTPADPIYQARYAEALPPNELPTIALARADGGVVYRASGANIPAPETLAAQLTEMATLATVHDQRHMIAPELPRRPDGGWMPNLRPNLIPDTVVIRPEISVPDASRWVVMGIILIVLLLSGLAVVALVFGLVHIFTK